MRTPEQQQAVELKRLARWVRHYARARGMSINAAIRRADLSQTSVYAALRGDSNPTLATLSALAAVLEVEVAQLLTPIPDEDEG